MSVKNVASLTESQRAAEAALESMVSNLAEMDDDATAEAHVLMAGVPLLAELKAASRAIWQVEIRKAVPGLEAEVLRATLRS